MNGGEARDRAIARELRLRGDPPGVTRLSRRSFAVAAGAVALGLSGVTGWALLNHHERPASPASPPAGAPTSPPRQVAELPKDYAAAPAAVPKLGPPLPGDLGGPFLKARNASVAGAAGRPATAAAPPQPDAAIQQARLQAEQARTSRLSVPTGDATRPAVPIQIPQPATPASLKGDREPRPETPRATHILEAGAVVRAALITAIRSDIPGPVTAQVTQDVFDSVTGRFRLIPQGSRLIGAYDSHLVFGQGRLQLTWTRLILPDGRSLDLGHEPGSDAQGLAGVSDRVDRHWGGLVGGALVSTILAIGAQLGAGSSESQLVQALRTGAAGAANQAGQQLVGKSLQTQPTLTIRAGAPVAVIVIKDLELEPWPL